MNARHAQVRLSRRIEWIDTDAAGIHHWTTVFRLVEAAETELYDGFGWAEQVYGALPRVHVTVDYRLPLRFNERVEVHLWVDDVGDTSISYGFLIRRGEEIAAKGSLVVVHIDATAGTPVSVPRELRHLLMTAPEAVRTP